MNLKILWMYHDLMDLYGDKGNAEVLRRRAEKRGIEVQLDTCTIGEEKNIDEYDISFQTAWSVPTGIVKRYSELCEDDEEFYWEYEDEDYDGTHILRKINGEIIDTIVPEYVNDNDYIDV